MKRMIYRKRSMPVKKTPFVHENDDVVSKVRYRERKYRNKVLFFFSLGRQCNQAAQMQNTKSTRYVGSSSPTTPKEPASRVKECVRPATNP